MEPAQLTAALTLIVTGGTVVDADPIAVLMRIWNHRIRVVLSNDRGSGSSG